MTPLRKARATSRASYVGSARPALGPACPRRCRQVVAGASRSPGHWRGASACCGSSRSFRRRSTRRERAPKGCPCASRSLLPTQAAFSVFDIPAVSPDGRRIVFLTAPAIGSETLWLRELDSLSARQLPGTEGRFLPLLVAGWASHRVLRRWSSEARGGRRNAADPMQDAGGGGGAWNQNAKSCFAGAQPDLPVSAAAGSRSPSRRSTSRAETQHRWPSFCRTAGTSCIWLEASSKPQECGLRALAGWIRARAARLR